MFTGCCSGVRGLLLDFGGLALGGLGWDGMEFEGVDRGEGWVAVRTPRSGVESLELGMGLARQSR